MSNTKVCQTVTLSKFVKCNYHDGTTIIIGKLENGEYALTIEKENNPEVLTKVILSPENVTGLFVALLLYAEAYEIDLNKKIKELLDTDNIFYYCKEKKDKDG